MQKDFDSKMNILFSNEYCIVVEKPAGLLVHPSHLARDKDTLMSRVRNKVGHHVYPIHRLDRATRGLVLLAKNSESASSFGKQFMTRQVEKHYLAIVRGVVPDSGTIDWPLLEEGTSKPADAVSNFQRLAQSELPFAVGPHESVRHSLVLLTPVTGRFHQLRKHMKHVFHPIIGDTIYGDGKQNRFFRSHFDIHSLMLFAFKLEFYMPDSDNKVAITADFSEFGDFEIACKNLGWQIEVQKYLNVQYKFQG